MSQIYFARAGRIGSGEGLIRCPELAPLREKTVALFGTGCLGAPSVLELARAGVGQLRILDHDFVDPATSARWPFGLKAAGLLKAEVLADFIKQHYPATRPVPFVHQLGSVRSRNSVSNGQGDLSDWEVVNQMITGASIIYDATAEIGVQDFLSEIAEGLSIPYVAVTGTHGGWGGRVVSIIPEVTKGCWMCYRYARDEGSIPEPPSDVHGEIQPQGCGDVTFTGAGFDMAEIALSGVRTAVAALCLGESGAYPKAPWDVLTVFFRDDSGDLRVPTFKAEFLEKHARCSRCSKK